MSRLLDLVHVLRPSDLGAGPPAGRQVGDVRGFSMTCQEELQWCWAAVAQALERKGGRDVSQSEVASRHIDPRGDGLVCSHPLGAGDGDSRCEECNAGCGDPHSLRYVLEGRGRLVPGGARHRLASFDDIRAAIDGGRPLPVRIYWGNNAAHFVCVTGYADDGAGTRRVTVHDPLVPGVDGGAVDERDLRYVVFCDAYPASDGSTGAPDYLYEVK